MDLNSPKLDEQFDKRLIIMFKYFVKSKAIKKTTYSQSYYNYMSKSEYVEFHQTILTSVIEIPFEEL